MHALIPGRKGTHECAVYCWKYAVFTPNFARTCITARYRPKPFTSGVIKNKVKKGALRFCACSNLRLLSFNDPEYRPLQACINVETPSSLIFEPRVWAWPDVEWSTFHVFPQISSLYPPTLALTVYLRGLFTWVSSQEENMRLIAKCTYQRDAPN